MVLLGRLFWAVRQGPGICGIRPAAAAAMSGVLTDGSPSLLRSPVHTVCRHEPPPPVSVDTGHPPFHKPLSPFRD
jgi:hypothetical protein